MHSFRARPICRAQNSFSPSIALWQHFVAPNEYLLKGQLRSPFASEATQRPDDDSSDPGAEGEALDLGDTSNAPPFRKYPAGKGNWQVTAHQRKRPEELRTHMKGKSGRAQFPGRHQETENLFKEAREAYDSAQDYEGTVVEPIRTKKVEENKLPWVIKNWEHKTARERLELEIQAFHEYVRPNRFESIARKHVIEQVRQHVQKILPDYVLEVFGSERTGLAFAASDLDLRLVPKHVISNAAQAQLPPTTEERAKRRRDLRRLHNTLAYKRRGIYLHPIIRWARYPLISLQDRASGLDIQIVLSNDTSHSREYMQRYMTEYSQLPQLYSVIKATLDMRGLSDVFRGGIGSYSIFMMIVASLKHRPHPEDNAGGSLYFFLRFWRDFKAEEHGVSIEPLEFFKKSEQAVMHAKAMSHIEEGKTPALPKWMLTLRDPADETNDLGRKIVAWKHIQMTLRNIALKLQRHIKVNSRPSLLAPLLGPIYSLHQARRGKLTEYGHYVATEGGNHGIEDLWSNFLTHTRGNNFSNWTDFKELAAIAQRVREGEKSDPQSAREAGSLNVAQENEEDAQNPWLIGTMKESGHQETGQALSDLLGLDKKEVSNPDGLSTVE